MGHIIRFVKDWTLPVAMIVGAVFYRYTSLLSFLTPYLIFLMLLITYTKLSPKSIKVGKLHVLMLAIQLIGSISFYVLFSYYDTTLAEGAFICLLAPTATAAAVITGMLGGSISFLAGYVIICNMVVSAIAPLLFSYIGVNKELPLLESSMHIAAEVFPLLILPLVVAWGLRFFLPKVHTKLEKMGKASYYLWALALIVVMGKTTKFILSQDSSSYMIEFQLALAALLACLFQFTVGRKLGRRIIDDPISAGQGLGQKNTILAIWMAHAYLNPIASIAPAAYVVWQNSINSWQLWKAKKRSIQ